MIGPGFAAAAVGGQIISLILTALAVGVAIGVFVGIVLF
jgi:hypothetical protein